MKLEFAPQFERDYKRLSDDVKDQTDIALTRLELDPHHPGLRVKKMKGYRGIWEARVSQSYRIIFEMSGESCLILRIGPHDILKRL